MTIDLSQEQSNLLLEVLIEKREEIETRGGVTREISIINELINKLNLHQFVATPSKAPWLGKCSICGRSRKHKIHQVK